MDKTRMTKSLRSKVLAHGLQALLVLVNAILTIAVITKAGDHDGRTNFAVALSFISLVPLVYLILTPQWQNSRRFFLPLVSLILDGLLTLLWLSAAIAVGTWNSSGAKQGAEKLREEKKDDKIEAGCDTFAFGSSSKCVVSKTSVAFMSIITFTFACTTALSVMLFRSGKLYEESGAYSHPNEFNDAWDTHMEYTNGPTGADSYTGGYSNSDGPYNPGKSPSPVAGYGDEPAHGSTNSDNQNYGQTFGIDTTATTHYGDKPKPPYSFS